MNGSELLLLSLILVAIELHAPGFAIFGIAGVISFTLGAVLLIHTSQPQHANWIILFIAVIGIIELLAIYYILTVAIQLRHRKKMHGTQVLIGKEGYALTPIHEAGQVKVLGEIWQASAHHPIEVGKKVTIVSAKGLILQVEDNELRSNS